MDETSLSHEELYKILINKVAKARKGSILAIVAGTKADTAIEVLRPLPQRQRNKVAFNVDLIAKKCFPKAKQVTDHFHV